MDNHPHEEKNPGQWRLSEASNPNLCGNGHPEDSIIVEEIQDPDTPVRVRRLYKGNETPFTIPLWALRALHEDCAQLARIRAINQALHYLWKITAKRWPTTVQVAEWVKSVQDWANADCSEGYVYPPEPGRKPSTWSDPYEPSLCSADSYGHCPEQEVAYRRTFAAVVTSFKDQETGALTLKKDRAANAITFLCEGIHHLRGDIYWALPWDEILSEPLQACPCDLAGVVDELFHAVIAQLKLEMRENQDAPKIHDDPPGIMADTLQWIRDCSMYPQPGLALMNIISALGALFGRKVRDNRNTRSNVLAVGIAKSGAGKDQSRQCIKNLFIEGGAGACMGGEDLASAPGLIESMQQSPSRLYQIDEAGLFFENVNSKQATSHQKEIPSTFMRLYSSAGGRYLGKEYATRERPEIDQPCCCLFGTTTPGTFFGALKSGEVTSGFLPRMALLRARDDLPDAKDPTADEMRPPQKLIEFVQAWAQWQPPTPDDTGDIRATTGCFPKVIETTPEAHRMWKAFNDDMRDKARTAPDKIGPLYTRCGELANKLALISACSWGLPDDDLKIEDTDMAWAILVVEQLNNWMVQAVDFWVTDNPQHRFRNEVFTVIDEHSPISKRGILRKKPKWETRDVDRALKTLEDAGLVFGIPVQGSRGPETFEYVVTDEA